MEKELAARDTHAWVVEAHTQKHLGTDVQRQGTKKRRLKVALGARQYYLRSAVRVNM